MDTASNTNENIGKIFYNDSYYNNYPFFIKIIGETKAYYKVLKLEEDRYYINYSMAEITPNENKTEEIRISKVTFQRWYNEYKTPILKECSDMYWEEEDYILYDAYLAKNGKITEEEKLNREKKRKLKRIQREIEQKKNLEQFKQECDGLEEIINNKINKNEKKMDTKEFIQGLKPSDSLRELKSTEDMPTIIINDNDLFFYADELEELLQTEAPDGILIRLEKTQPYKKIIGFRQAYVMSHDSNEPLAPFFGRWLEKEIIVPFRKSKCFYARLNSELPTRYREKLALIEMQDEDNLTSNMFIDELNSLIKSATQFTMKQLPDFDDNEEMLDYAKIGLEYICQNFYNTLDQVGDLFNITYFIDKYGLETSGNGFNEENVIKSLLIQCGAIEQIDEKPTTEFVLKGWFASNEDDDENPCIKITTLGMHEFREYLEEVGFLEYNF